jgi:hypothetical protein
MFSRVPAKGLILLTIAGTLTACGLFTYPNSTPPPEDAKTAESKSPASKRPAFHSVSFDQIRAWADRSTEIDCPMTDLDAVTMRTMGGSSDVPIELIHSIGCACAVDYDCEGPQRGMGRCDLEGSLKRARDAASWQQEYAAMIPWGERLMAKDGADVRALTRAEALLAAKPPVTDDEQKQSKAFESMEKSLRTMDASVKDKTWYLIEGAYDHIKVSLTHIETVMLCGEQSVPGRALLVEADKLMDASREKIAQLKQVQAALRKDGQYQSLQAKERKLDASATRMANDRNIADGNYDSYCSDNSGENSSMCATNDKLDKIREQMDEIVAKYERKFGYRDP